MIGKVMQLLWKTIFQQSWMSLILICLVIYGVNIIYLHESWSSNGDTLFIKHHRKPLLRIFSNEKNISVVEYKTQNFQRREINKLTLNYTGSKDHNWYVQEPHIAGLESQFVIFVQSRHLATTERDFIRATWANNSYYKDDVRKRPFVFFVCGMDPNFECVSNNLRREILANKDILLINMLDSYDNLTLKGLLAMRWIATRLGASVKYVIKTDDDVMLNTFRWISILDSSFFKKKSRFILGYVWQRSEVKRNGKYAVGKEQYPGRYFPSFCAGPGYAMTRDTVFSLLNMTSSVPFVNREDVFITGMLAVASHVPRYSFSKNSCILYSNQIKETITWHSTMLVHNGNISSKRGIWDKYTIGSKVKSNSFPQIKFVTSEMWPENPINETVH